MKYINFPDPELADDDGLLAFGGDLEPETLLQAYSSGIFPWSVNPISWWSPDPRAIFELATFKPTTRMARMYRSGRFSFSTDARFTDVMRGCACSAPGRETTWISPEFVRAYTKLHRLGHAHSVEVYCAEKLVGGVYGVALGGFFAGESMFSDVSNASTMGLLYLFKHLKNRGFELFDSQVLTPHTSRLGAVEISRAQYLQRLNTAIKKNCFFDDKK
ncbi:MAG: leucyl/phenylalanyl-tRNA--protein transferase [Candidatus Riflebacteria bacterium HGW-Riflebacteria-1]|jgi:leucyl/phenylalanyl-tRNA--protein transferase|nr:MAG: leucyl/phenylalanyl-tRNA--protein transferase [Candidatus Riflebacteria bacterium HGW-Riflebacteria-1]